MFLVVERQLVHVQTADRRQSTQLCTCSPCIRRPTPQRTSENRLGEFAAKVKLTACEESF
jgi:hypothetical protein